MMMMLCAHIALSLSQVECPRRFSRHKINLFIIIIIITHSTTKLSTEKATTTTTTTTSITT